MAKIIKTTMKRLIPDNPTFDAVFKEAWDRMFPSPKSFKWTGSIKPVNQAPDTKYDTYSM